MHEDTHTSADAWHVEMMRLTAFPAPRPRAVNAAEIARTWWSKLFSEPYEQTTQDLRSGITRIQGKVNDAYMLVVENPVSFELRCLAGDPAKPTPEADALPHFAAAVESFQALAVRWLGLEDCPPLRRLAFGATLLIPVANQKIGNEILNKYLPHVAVHSQSSDFLYQINRRRPSSALRGLHLNRLSKWSIQEVQDLTISADGSVIQGPGVLACRLELDMNTVPSLDPLPQNHFPNLFGELVELAGEIARDGDIQ